MTIKQLTILLADWSDFLVMIVALLSLLVVRKNDYFKLMSAYLFSLAILNIATMITANYQINNAYLYHVIGYVEVFFTFLLYRKLGLNKQWDYAFFILSVGYISDSIYLIANGVHEINSIGQSLCMLFIIVLGFNFLWKLYQEEKVEDLGRYPYFYINAGLTLFASGGFFGYLLIARLTNEAIPAINFYYSWLIIAGFVYVKFILIGIGIVVERKYAK